MEKAGEAAARALALAAEKTEREAEVVTRGVRLVAKGVREAGTVTPVVIATKCAQREQRMAWAPERELALCPNGMLVK